MLTFESFSILDVSKTIKGNLESLKHTASEHNLCSLSLNQVYVNEKAFVIFKGSLVDNSWQNPKQYINEDFYKLYLNPRINKIEDRTLEFEEEICPSFPMLSAKIRRFKKIKVNYMDENLDEQEEVLEGFRSRIFQHELDHLNGRDILDWRNNCGLIEIAQGADKLFPNLKASLEEYKDQIEKLRKQFPEQFEPRNEIQLNQYDLVSQRPSWEQDQMVRLLRKCRKDLKIQLEKQEKQDNKEDKEKYIKK